MNSVLDIAVSHAIENGPCSKLGTGDSAEAAERLLCILTFLTWYARPTTGKNAANVRSLMRHIAGMPLTDTWRLPRRQGEDCSCTR